MSKKSLPILLILPFAVSILSVYAINFNVNLVSEDLQDIRFDYRQNEGFAINSKTLLEATPIGSEKALQDLGNALVWTASNSEYASISQENDSYYLNALSAGETTITVSNLRNTISRSFNAVIFEDGAIIINSVENTSSAMIDDKQYFGQYDFNNNHDGHTNKEISLSVEVLPSDMQQHLVLDDSSDNVSYGNNKITFKNINEDVEDAYLTFSIANTEIKSTYEFGIVKDGYNIYDYNDLLYCTNYSNEGLIGVLQTNLESLINTYKSEIRGNEIYYFDEYLNEDTKLFGNFDFEEQELNFDEEVYRFETTYNDKFIEEWNAVNQDKISNLVISGIHIQKDFYGNGFIINGHNLTYPTLTSVSSDGVTIPILGSDDLFRGPLPFVTLGDHNNDATLLIEAYGQDNSLIYVDGNNITLNDINMRNADFGNNLNNLNTVGTGIDVFGDNITIKNSQIRNAKNNVRVYSSENFLLDNSLLTNARQFLLSVGTNEYEEIDHTQNVSVYDINGQSLNIPTNEFFAKSSDGMDFENLSIADNILMNMAAYGTDILGSVSLDNVLKALEAMQNVLSPISKIVDQDNNPIYKTTVNVNDTYFYQSGIASISLETMFNGAYVYNSLPTLINQVLQSMVPMLNMEHISGVNYPSQVTLSGNTKFYDYKEVDSLDVSSIIKENISRMFEGEDGQLGDIFEGVEVNVDSIFPYRKILKEEAMNMGIGHQILDEESSSVKLYVNTPIVYYGGGLNLSNVIDNSVGKEYLSSPQDIDITTYSLTKPVTSSGEMILNVLARCVPIAIGFSPFKVMGYKQGYLYGETPNINDLINNAKEEL